MLHLYGMQGGHNSPLLEEIDFEKVFGKNLVTTEALLKFLDDEEIFLFQDEINLDKKRQCQHFIESQRQLYLENSFSKTHFESLLEKHYDPSHAGDFDFYYGDIAPDEYFRLFVDVCKQKDRKEMGFVGYERREKRCLQAMYDAFQGMMDSLDTPLSASFIKSLHATAAKPIPALPGGGFQYKFPDPPIRPGQFKSSAFGNIRMGFSTITPLGFFEMYTDMQATDCYLPYSDDIVIYLGYPKGGYEAKVTEYIEKYHKEVGSPSPFEKLKAIVAFVQKVERLHPFYDGNLRTCSTLLLQRELLIHGFSPSLMDDPNMLDGFSIEEAMYQVLCGMENFQALRQYGHIPDTISTPEILATGASLPIDHNLKNRIGFVK